MSIIDAVNIIMMGIMDAWRWVTNVVSTVIITAFGFSLGGIFLYFWQKEKQREETSISSWLDRIKKIEDIDIDNTGNPNKFFEIDISFIKEIEAYRNFKNILWYCPILKAVWNDFKNSIVEYNSEKQKLINILKEHIEQELKKHNFNIGSEIKDGFYLSVYKEIIFRVKGEISPYDYFYDDSSQQPQLKYCQFFDSGQIRSDRCHDLAEIQPQEKRKDIENYHKDLIKECKKRCFDELYLTKLIEMESKTKKAKEKLNYILEERPLHIGFFIRDPERKEIKWYIKKYLRLNVI